MKGGATADDRHLELRNVRFCVPRRRAPYRNIRPRRSTSPRAGIPRLHCSWLPPVLRPSSPWKLRSSIDFAHSSAASRRRLRDRKRESRRRCARSQPSSDASPIAVVIILASLRSRDVRMPAIAVQSIYFCLISISAAQCDSRIAPNLTRRNQYASFFCLESVTDCHVSGLAGKPRLIGDLAPLRGKNLSR